ncbi:MAG: hypothetical protein AABY87_02280 [bacterium]
MDKNRLKKRPAFCPFCTHTHTFNKSGYFKDGMARIYFVRLNPDHD